MSTEKIISVIVALIGVYMIVINIDGGLFVPPVLSGVAFVLIGVMSFIKV